MNIEQRPIGEITPYEKNAKQHPKDQVDKIAASIREFGFNQPLVVDTHGVIIVGHGRYAAALELGLETVPAVVLHVSEDKARAYRLADNKLNESEWDMDLVIEELKGLSEDLIDLTGFDSDLLIENDDKDDVLPTEPSEYRTQTGDVILLGRHLLVCGDSTDPATYEKLMEGTEADMVFTDPPYNVDYKGSGKETSEGIMNDHMDAGAFLDFLRGGFVQMRQATKAGAGWYVFHSHKTQTTFEQALAAAGLEVVTQLIWNKPSAGLGMNDYRTKHEPFFYDAQKGHAPQFYGDRTGTTVIDFHKSDQALLAWAKRQKQAESDGKTTIWTMRRDNVSEYVHPTQKPVELVTYALLNSSKEGDLVLDPFAGSGTTLIACEKTGRSARTIELDPKFCDRIIQRYVNYTGITEIERNGIPEMWEVTD